MRATDIIMKKRDGGELSRDEIAFLVDGYVKGEIPEYQVSAWLMAVFFKGMTFEETASFTDVMLRSGAVFDLSGIDGPFVDKHSTGGVGDKVSLVLAPVAAACGVRVPMMSGRSLGHTGGTLDKLESIPGYKASLEPPRFRELLSREGFAMTGQTKEIVPADRLLYALRDVTGTVESIPLITASILSKKVAEGAEALVFDVKSGPGAFMKTVADAERLANSLVRTGHAMGKRIVGVITDMSEPLGRKVGNFLEVEESIDCLQGRGPADLMEVTYRLTAWMLVAGGKASGVEEGIKLCRAAIESGKAYELFEANVRAQGGDLAKMRELCGKHRSAHRYELLAEKDGFVSSIDAYKIGLAGVYLGVGRSKTTDPVWPDVGFEFDRIRGEEVRAGDRVFTMWGKDAASVEAALPLARESVSIGDKPGPQRLVLKEITAL